MQIFNMPQYHITSLYNFNRCEILMSFAWLLPSSGHRPQCYWLCPMRTFFTRGWILTTHDVSVLRNYVNCRCIFALKCIFWAKQQDKFKGLRNTLLPTKCSDSGFLRLRIIILPVNCRSINWKLVIWSEGNAVRMKAPSDGVWRHPLPWRHNELAGVSNHQPHDCLLNRLFTRRSKKTSKLRVTGLCVGNSPGAGEFPAQRASNAENASIWWRHHDIGMGHVIKGPFY